MYLGAGLLLKDYAFLSSRYFDQFEHNYFTSMSGAGQKVKENDTGNTFHVTILRTKSTRQMIYLEAEKDLVDVLLSFLVLPVGTIIRMLNAEGVKERKFGAMDNIFKSVEKLQESMLYVNKTLFTEPRPDSAACRGSVVLQLTATPTFYRLCYSCQNWIHDARFICSCCSNSKNYASLYNPKEGYAKESVTFIVCNNLEIMPTSTINTMDVLSKMKVLNLSDLLSIAKEICRNDVLSILLAAISGSETPLSDVFGAKVK